MERPALDRALTGLAAAWLGAVAVIELLPDGPGPPQLASRPETLVDGELWRLLTSSLVAAGPGEWAQIVLVATTTVVVLVCWDGRTWWETALAGHVGATLAAYALIGTAWALGSRSAERAADAWDYGVSCVLLAQVGWLAADGVDRLRRDRHSRAGRAEVAACVAATAFSVATLSWYGTEHLFALAIGGGLFALRRRSR